MLLTKQQDRGHIFENWFQSSIKYFR